MRVEAVIDQREIQKRGNGCGRYPVSCLIRDLLEFAGVLKPLSTINVIDLTFGEGRFWSLIPRAKVWGFDVRVLRWVRKPYVFFNDSAENWYCYMNRLPQRVDLIVADPPFMPYKRGQERRRHYEDHGSLPVILRAAEKAAKHYNAPLLVHFLWKTIPYGFEVLAEAWFQPYVRYTKQPLPTWFGVLKPRG